MLLEESNKLLFHYEMVLQTFQLVWKYPRKAEARIEWKNKVTEISSTGIRSKTYKLT